MKEKPGPPYYDEPPRDDFEDEISRDDLVVIDPDHIRQFINKYQVLRAQGLSGASLIFKVVASLEEDEIPLTQYDGEFGISPSFLFTPLSNTLIAFRGIMLGTPMDSSMDSYHDPEEFYEFNSQGIIGMQYPPDDSPPSLLGLTNETEP